MICPKTKLATHCPPERKLANAPLFPIYQNLNIGPSNGGTIVTSTDCPTVLYWRLSDFNLLVHVTCVSLILFGISLCNSLQIVECEIVLYPLYSIALKVSYSRKQISKFSFEPKTQRKYFCISALISWFGQIWSDLVRFG